MKTTIKINPVIPQQKIHNETLSWTSQLADAFCNVHELCEYLQIAEDDLPLFSPRTFSLKVPRCYADCMEPGNPNDPLLKQVIPLQQELLQVPGYSSDPVGDLGAMTGDSVIHKYQGRVLLITTGACAINCRYCFRRNFPYRDVQLTPSRQQQAVDYIERHNDITEVILSGGDPLMMSDTKLATLLQKLQPIPHLKRIRIHSRLPVVLPARITQPLLTHLGNSSKQIVLVIHANHANELSQQVASACLQLKKYQVTLLNQSVLLKGVNDTDDQLCQLSEKLFVLGVLPYYLHLLDKTTGTAHFEVSREQAIQLMQQLKNRLSGYLVPRLVKEVAGQPHKVQIE